MERTRKPKKASPPKVALGATAKENLPFPIVYYPMSSAFLGFSQNESSPAVLCSCTESAIENLIRLCSTQTQFFSAINENLLNLAYLQPFFPRAVVLPNTGNENLLSSIPFSRRLCHRCNLAMPTLLYCHPMYGGRFKQQYGWYIDQTYLRLGIHPQNLNYLPDMCPPEYQQDICAIKEVTEEYTQASRDFNEQYQQRYRYDDKLYWRERNQELQKLRLKSEQTRRTLTRKIENITREEFGVRKVGEGWVSETMLYQIIKRLFPDQEIIRHHRPEWLKGLELDIYVPAQKLAFEYQGQQHFVPIKTWGGQKALEELRDRDARKAVVCRKEGVRLVTVDYTEPLTEEHIRSLVFRP